jgi:hypothetical protein
LDLNMKDRRISQVDFTAAKRNWISPSKTNN